MRKDQDLNDSRLVENLRRNEFIPAETVDHFVTKNLERNTGDRPSKKMFYSRPAKPGKQELMEEH